MQRWVASAHGGISQRSNPGPATMRSLLRSPAMIRLTSVFARTPYERWLRLGARVGFFHRFGEILKEDALVDEPQDENSVPKQADDRARAASAHLATGVA